MWIKGDLYRLRPERIQQIRGWIAYELEQLMESNNRLSPESTLKILQDHQIKDLVKFRDELKTPVREAKDADK